jgi:hypothetical protein
MTVGISADSLLLETVGEGEVFGSASGAFQVPARPENLKICKEIIDICKGRHI